MFNDFLDSSNTLFKNSRFSAALSLLSDTGSHIYGKPSLKSYFLRSVWIFIALNVSVVAVENSIASSVNRMQFKKLGRLRHCSNKHSQSLHCFERGVDVSLVLLIYDALQTVKLQFQLQVGEC